METHWLTSLFLLLSAGAQTSHNHTGLSCVNDYINNVSCVWNDSFRQLDKNCSLNSVRETFEGSDKRSCELKPLSGPGHASRGCHLLFDLTFSHSEKILIRVRCGEQVVAKLEKYQPGRHVKMHPPGTPNVTRGNVSWSPGSPFSQRIFDYEFQLQYKEAHRQWEEVYLSHVQQTWVQLNNDALEQGESYHARVRVKPTEDVVKEDHIRGQWSDWSPVTSWRSDVGKLPPRTAGIIDKLEGNPTFIALLLGAVVLAAIVTIIICKVHTDSRVFKVKCQHVPDPSKYFQTLHSVHGGNFQKWLSPLFAPESFLAPQPCDDISPVEVAEAWEPYEASLAMATLIHGSCIDTSDGACSGQSSSGFSNMGYFCSECQSGAPHFEPCHVYSSHQPDRDLGGRRDDDGRGILQSGSSYERLLRLGHQTEPRSPDSGFGLEGEGEEGVDDQGDVASAVCSAPFILSLPQGPWEAPAPLHIHSFSQLHHHLSGFESAVAPGDSCTPEPPEGALARSSSMTVQPCGSGYLSVKEMMQNTYSNKSI